MSFFADVFIKIADKMGLTVQYKEKPDKQKYSDHKTINLTSTIANRVTTLTMLDSTSYIDGESARAKAMSDFLEYYTNEILPIAAEVSLGTGDCLVKPWTDGERIGVSVVANDDFRICESVGGFVKALIMRCEKLDIGQQHYERFEGQRISGNTVTITQFVYKDGQELPENEWPLAWQEIEKEVTVSGCYNLLLGRIKCPTINREDPNSGNGVRITYGLDSVLENAVKAYERFNDEAEKKETMVFADRTLFTADKDGNRILPSGKGKLFQAVRGKDGGELIHEYSPDMRTDQLEKGVDVNFKMLELMAGLSNGILTAPSTTFATATEMKASLQNTYAFITRFRNYIMNGTRELLDAVDILMNLTGISPMGDWDVRFDWSSSYIENMEEQFTRLVTAHGIGAVDAAEVRSWVMDEDLATAEERVNEIAGRADEAAADII